MNYKEELSNLLSSRTNLEAQQIASMLEVPPEMEMGDFALPCFKLAKVMRKAPPAIAQQIAASFEELPSWLDRMEVAGGYLNFFLSRSQFACDTLREIAEKQERYGSSEEGRGAILSLTILPSILPSPSILAIFPRQSSAAPFIRFSISLAIILWESITWATGAHNSANLSRPITAGAIMIR